jgi:hypothetical protein
MSMSRLFMGGESLPLVLWPTIPIRPTVNDVRSERCWSCFIGRMLRLNRSRRRIGFGDTRSALRRHGVPGLRRRSDAERQSRLTARQTARAGPWSARRFCASGGSMIAFAKSTRAVGKTVLTDAPGSCGGPGMSGAAPSAIRLTRRWAVGSGNSSCSCWTPRRCRGC